MDESQLLDTIENKLLSIRNGTITSRADLTVDEIYFLCDKAQMIFLEYPCLLELSPPLTIVGDIHAQFLDLIRIFELAKFPPNTNYLFLGDYVDRGKQSIETVCLLFVYKIKYPDQVHMLRGNHECSYINRLYGFYDECQQFYGIDVWRRFSDVFNCLPIAAIIEEKIFCVHGGISPKLESLDDIKNIKRPIEIPEIGRAHV